MEILIGVENFGKIQKAEITLGDFTVFVGNNNSGKTYMMQLMYGVLKEISRIEPTHKGIIPLEDGDEFGEEWIHAWERQINDYLDKKKEQIVADIFHNPVDIEKLYVAFPKVDYKYVCHIADWEFDNYDVSEGENDEPAVVIKNQGKAVKICAVSLADNEELNLGELRFPFIFHKEGHRKFVLRWIKNDILGWGNRMREGILFLPASRTGLLLLYKYFFSEKDKMNTENFLIMGDDKLISEEQAQGNEFGLSAPVYDFLQFLLRYVPHGPSRLRNRGVLQFIEKNMLDGKLSETDNETYYIPHRSKTSIPLYLSSSLINEIAPVVKALSGATSYKYIFYDEVETCLHPLMQGEMARLLIRLVNSGRRLVISTHSDTMAAKLNNLLLLANSGDSEEVRRRKLRQLKYTNGDLLHSSRVHVYQFKNGQDGKSTARELEFRTTPYAGYDFEQFGDNLDKLVAEAEIILEQE